MASATGSGDNAIAGFLTALLNGLSPEECLHVACAVGAHNVTVLDATSGVRSWDETLAGLPDQEPVDPRASTGFSYEEDLGLWRGSCDGRGLHG